MINCILKVRDLKTFFKKLEKWIDRKYMYMWTKNTEGDIYKHDNK